MSNKTLKITALMCSFLFLSGCRQENNDMTSDTHTLFAMDTFMNLTAYGSNADAALSEAEARIKQLESELSATSDKSDIWKLNNSAGVKTEVSTDTAFLIQKAKEFGVQTNGCLDITVYPVLKEWGFTTGEYHIPENDRIDKLLSFVDYKMININGVDITLPENVQIDLGSIAKGYTGDEVIRIMREKGIVSAIVNLGGNVQTLGSKPDGSDWKVAVRDPFQPDTDMCVVSVSDKAVVTSGNYERYFVGEDGNTYWHIIDPKDGYPADNGIVSATVIGREGIVCDALSTAVFVAGEALSPEIISEYADYDFIIVTGSGKIFYTDGISESFRNISSMPAEVMKID